MFDNLGADLASALLVYVLQTLAVSLITIRILVMARGYERRSVVLGFFEALIYVLALGFVVQNLENVFNILAYSLGFSTGLWVGIRLERRMALGHVTLHIFSSSDGDDIAAALRDEGFGATVTQGRGRRGPVDVILAVVPRRNVAAAHQLITEVDPAAFIAYDAADTVAGGWTRVFVPRIDA